MSNFVHGNTRAGRPLAAESSHKALVDHSSKGASTAAFSIGSELLHAGWFHQLDSTVRYRAQGVRPTDHWHVQARERQVCRESRVPRFFSCMVSYEPTPHKSVDYRP